eukprot:6548919-Karenia_brevis.AAC.1
MIALSTLHYNNWRLALADYRGADLRQCEQQLLSIRFGSYPLNDIPWLRKLSDEIYYAANQL